MRLQIDQPPRARDGRVIRRLLVQLHLQKPPQRQRIRRPPRDPALTVDPLEIADQQQSEVPPRHERRSPHRLRIEALTLAFDEFVELALFQQLVEPLVEWMPRRPRQLRMRDPEIRLVSPLLRSPSHRHDSNVQTKAVNRSTFFALRIQTFTTDC
jgi:hypothetical protein